MMALHCPPSVVITMLVRQAWYDQPSCEPRPVPPVATSLRTSSLSPAAALHRISMPSPEVVPRNTQFW